MQDLHKPERRVLFAVLAFVIPPAMAAMAAASKDQSREAPIAFLSILVGCILMSQAVRGTRSLVLTLIVYVPIVWALSAILILGFFTRGI